MTYSPYARPDDTTPPCDEDLRRASTEKRTWHDEPGDVTRLQDELHKSIVHRARTNTLDINPWAFFARL